MIRVSIIAYMDNELPHTIEDLFVNANNPEEVVVYVYNQDDSEYKYNGEYCVKTYHVTPNESDGYSSCRYKLNNIILSESDKDDYYLQVAPHSRFAKGWDKKLIEVYDKLSKKYNKVLVCARQHEYDLPSELHGEPFYYAPIVGWSASCVTAREKVAITTKEPFEVFSFQAGGVFTKMDWVVDVLPNPDIFLWGEETDIPLRTFAAGYRMFHLPEPQCYHLYHQKNRKALGYQYEPDKYEARNEAGKKLVLEKLYNSKYPMQKEWFEKNRLDIEGLKKLYNKFIISYCMTESQCNDVNNIKQEVHQMILDAMEMKEFNKLLKSMYEIKKIVRDFYKEIK